MTESIKNQLYKLNAWTLHWAETPHAMFALFILAFVESSFFPIPPDVLIVALLLTGHNYAKWWKYALVAAIGSILGGALGYLIGFGFYEVIGKRIVDFYNLEETVTNIGLKYSQNSFLTVFTAAFTPIPFKVITISAGFFKTSITSFVIASVIGRSLRFFILAYLLKVFGAPLKKIIYKYFNILSIIFVIFLIGGFIALKYIF